MSLPDPQGNAFENADVRAKQDRLDIQYVEETQAYEDNPDLVQAKNNAAMESLGITPFVTPDEKDETQVSSLDPSNIEDVMAVGDPVLQRDAEKHDDRGMENSEAINESALNEEVFAPLINRLVKDNVISPQIGIDIKLGLQENGDFQEVIEGSEIDSEIQKLVIDRWGELNNEESAREFQKDFQEDFGENFSSFQNKKGEFTSERAKDAYDMIGTSYMIGEGGHTEEDQLQALNMAFEMGINMEIEGKVFKRNLEFENNFKTVKDENSSITERFEAFINVMSIIGTDQGAKGGKRKNDRLMAQKRTTLKAAGLEEQYILQQKTFTTAQEAGDKESIQKAEFALQETLEQAQDLSSGDIGTFDTVLETGGTESGETTQKTA